MAPRSMSGDFVTVTVLGSGASGTPDGRAALSLRTKEAGTIAFEVNLQAISAIRESLLECEKLLKAPKGHA